MEIDRSIIGRTTQETILEVGKRDIRRFAEATVDSNPLYSDEEAAKQTRYGGIIAPPIFPAAIIVESGFPITFDFRRALHGEEEFIFHRQIRPGDRLHCQAKVVDLIEREGRSGAMKFIVIDTDAKDEAGAPVVTCRTTIVYR